jgi:anti-sigma B factor antagonist
VRSVSTESFDALLATAEAPFRCAVHRRGASSEIELEGELDLAARRTLQDAVGTALEPGPVDTLVIDMTDVTFADSTTITWLLTSAQRMEAGGGRLVVVVASGPVRDLLALTGLDQRLTLVPDAGTLQP